MSYLNKPGYVSQEESYTPFFDLSEGSKVKTQQSDDKVIINPATEQRQILPREIPPIPEES